MCGAEAQPHLYDGDHGLGKVQPAPTLPRPNLGCGDAAAIPVIPGLPHSIGIAGSW